MQKRDVSVRADKDKLVKRDPPVRSSRLILARIDAGIDDANKGRFATAEEVKKEFARWRDAR